MKISAVLVVALALGVNNASSQPEKLVGAKNADIGEFPYQVSLRMNGQHFCGGALISEKHVLTAAHCVMATRKVFFGVFTVVVGTNSLSTGGQSYKVSEKSQHPDYKDKRTPDWMYDIGVLTLSTEVKLSDRVGLVKLPTKDVEIDTEAIVSGWGTMKTPTSPVSQSLQKLTLDIISFKSCKDRMPYFAKVHASHICTFVKKGLGTCSGDSGGPLVQDGIVIGVVSGGIPCARGYPDVFTNVFTYLSYVEKNMK